MKHKVNVIGSGFAGLSVATHLAHEGYDVDVFEKNDSLGGRARKFEKDGFTFDMGPSWYWMPDVFEQYFAKFGKTVEDYYDLIRLDPSYRVYFAKDHKMDLPASMEGMYELFEKYEPGSSKNLKKFLEEAAYKYEVGINDLVYKPGQSLLEFLDMRVIKGAVRLQLLNSLSSHVRKYFKNPFLIELLEFPVLFLGAKASKTPALYSLMNYADIVLGTWYPMGGMHKIVEAMVSLAEEKGVKFHTSENVSEILIENGKATGIKLENGAEHKSDFVVSGADYHHTETKMLAEKARNYSDTYWEKRTMAPSSILYYVGLNKRIDGILHHNLFFDTDFQKHAEQIYDNPEWPEEPLFYVSATSVTDKTVAPEGCENIFILIPTAPGLMDDQKIKDRYFEMVMKRMEETFEQNIRDHVIFRRDFACSDFIQDYNSFKGNAYGLANTLNQTAVLKPSLKNKQVKNLYYTGQLTVPGPGVPPSLISGAVVAKEVMKAS
ncbi:MAG: phytoene desaturase [Cryomorphaceae bacterium]|jgi:phytoene desaturase